MHNCLRSHLCRGGVAIHVLKSPSRYDAAKSTDENMTRKDGKEGSSSASVDADDGITPSPTNADIVENNSSLL
eukprot:5059976-Ditylum_brightwellii.AAC.1